MLKLFRAPVIRKESNQSPIILPYIHKMFKKVIFKNVVRQLSPKLNPARHAIIISFGFGLVHCVYRNADLDTYTVLLMLTKQNTCLFAGMVSASYQADI